MSPATPPDKLTTADLTDCCRSERDVRTCRKLKRESDLIIIMVRGFNADNIWVVATFEVELCLADKQYNEKFQRLASEAFEFWTKLNHEEADF